MKKRNIKLVTFGFAAMLLASCSDSNDTLNPTPNIIGVDVDQNYIGANGVADGTYAYNPFITSAMKGLSEAVNTALSDIEAGDWSEIAASNGNFGLEDGDYIGLPTADDSWNFETFTKDEYETVKEKIKSGEITVDNNSDDATKPTVSEFTTVNYIQ